MTEPLIIALDAMGGDNAPDSVIEGAAIAAEKFPDVKFLLFGDEAKIKPLVERYHHLGAQVEIIHTDSSVAMNEKPSIALRQGKTSSMRLAIEAVEQDKAGAIVSAGNTGALMAMSKIVLRTLPGISRPAMVGLFPTIQEKTTVMLDVGANVEADSNDLVQFAIMGDAFARAVLGLESPTVGLLNVGSEEMKGHDEVKAAHLTLKSSGLPINYIGFVEGNDIAAGTVDVIVTDGFTGNVALKTTEGTAQLLIESFKGSFKHDMFAKMTYLISSPVISRVRKKLDPRLFNGAMFIGLNGISVKSHGGADGFSFAQAIKVAISLVQNKINDSIIEEVKMSDLSGPNGNGVH